MKSLVYACAFLAVATVAQETSIRVLDADVLRDFPGKCFGSTVCRVFNVDDSWPLFPFCGKATCIKNSTGLFEKVEDCGPRVKPTEKCSVRFPETEKESGPFPACCPKITCTGDAKPQYYTPEEVKTLVAEEKAAREAAAAAAVAAQGPVS